jgi:tetratricopeptide (TPR) repeat protein
LLINVFEALIQYYSNKVYGYTNLGSLYGATKRYDEAREYYEKTLEVNNKELSFSRISTLLEENIKYLMDSDRDYFFYIKTSLKVLRGCRFENIIYRYPEF